MPVAWADILAHWDALEFSFTAIGLDLEAAYRSRTFRWFCAHVRGLLSTDSLIARCFVNDPEPEAPSE